ncbi:MAG: hypothetical protein WC766_06475 [Patescibacteria group bacterium]
MDTKSISRLVRKLKRSRVFAILAILAFAMPALAIVNYAPSAGLGTGSVRSTHILNGTIVNADHSTSDKWQFGQIVVATSSPSANLTVWSAATSGQTAFNVVTVGSTTAFAVLDNSRVGIGTSSPMSALAVVGTTTTTGLQTPGGARFALPTTEGTAGQALLAGSNGATSWGTSADWQQVGQTVNAGAQTTLTVSSLPNRKHYKVFIFYHGNLGGDSILTFNADSGNNYSWRSSSNGAADVTGVNAAGVNMGTPGEWTDMQQTLWFSQVAGHEKTFFFTSTGGNPPATAPTYVTGAGAWANATNAVSEIKITSAANLPADSFMTVYASKD